MMTILFRSDDKGWYVSSRQEFSTTEEEYERFRLRYNLGLLRCCTVFERNEETGEYEHVDFIKKRK